MDRQPRTNHRHVRVTLWTLIVPPVVWATHFLFSYLWAAISCAKRGEFATLPWLFVVGTAIAIIVISASGWIAWRQARAEGDPRPHDRSADVDRLRFLAKSTLLLAALSLLGVIYTALPVVFLKSCV